MRDAADIIRRFCRRVLLRERLLALQDHAAISLLAGGIISAGGVLYARLHPGSISPWLVSVLAFGAVGAGLLTRWFLTRPDEGDAALKADRALGLEDRLATALAILRRGGVSRVLEAALLDDSAERLKNAKAAQVAPYRLRAWHALGLLGVAALTITLAVPERSLPGGEEMIAERADIQAAAEVLEQAASEIEREVPPETDTAKLAREQAELGRLLRRATGSRAEALKRLGQLEERIRIRHDQLASTRADEIVGLAERRLRSALASRPEKLLPKEAANGEAILQPEDGPATSRRSSSTALARPRTKTKTGAEEEVSLSKTAQTKSDPSDVRAGADPKSDQVAAQATPQPDRGGNSDSSLNAQKREDGTEPQSKEQPAGPAKDETPRQSPGRTVTSTTQQTAETARNNVEPEKAEANAERQDSYGDAKPAPTPDSEPTRPDGLTGFMAGQAAKALPRLSEQLMEKAAQLRAGQLSDADVKQLQQAAETLARDLAQVAQSKEFQQALEQLAKQVKPEQIEAVARQLLSNEKLRQELQATARMLMENQQAREMVAGLAQKFGEMQAKWDRENPDQRRRQQARVETGQKGGDIDSSLNSKGGGQTSQTVRGQGSGAGPDQRGVASDQLSRRGKDMRITGNLKRGNGGEYLYLQSRPGAGAARAPYSSAYPRYRREAEHSVRRSQVPAHLRSVVRDYFDAINPDAKKKP